MGEHHAEDTDGTEATRARPAASGRPVAAGADTTDAAARSGRRSDWAKARERGVGLLAGIARWVGLAFAVVLVLRVIFVVGEANPDNGIVSFVADASSRLALGFEDLFVPADPKLAVLLNYGIAAVFWLVASSIVARLIRTVGGLGRAV